ncbi:Acyl-CoA thioesterase 2 [Smittium culicis]|uniref:Acyl-CoA thioesterase 2 n=1 Tax=Smittium culicis TaxID=133412 RepID=A0A1R1WXS3_9FUNG|nr:Acyl-CoA thioesterase 2 [Smittium culicis]OMJ07854.1 Acyl-CoA thioesterase 2 [Smittium culicis]OMJ20919.1 Acyl-CoA thioesterase 2 [Smittium culicis]
MMCSFQVFEESGIEHQYEMPQALDPEMYNSDLFFVGDRSIFGNGNSKTIVDLGDSVGVIGKLVSASNMKSQKDVPEINDGSSRIGGSSSSGSSSSSSSHRSSVGSSADSTSNDPYRKWWFKAVYESGKKFEHQTIEQSILTYFSDFRCLYTSSLPHNLRFNPNDKGNITMMASLDHSVWFHSKVDASEWMLYEMESGRASCGRGHVTGRVFSKSGVLVATVAQEGLLRVTKSNKKVVPKIIKSNPAQLL